MVEIIEITEEFIEKSTPSLGEITYDEEFDKGLHGDEVNTAEWLVKTFGGDIRLLCESKRQGEQMPDYLWRGKYWERKGISSSKTNTIDARIRKAYAQIDGIRGGIILDFSQSRLSLQQAIKLTRERTLKRARGMVEMIIASNGEFVVWKITKK